MQDQNILKFKYYGSLNINYALVIISPSFGSSQILMVTNTRILEVMISPGGKRVLKLD